MVTSRAAPVRRPRREFEEHRKLRAIVSGQRRIIACILCRFSLFIALGLGVLVGFPDGLVMARVTYLVLGILSVVFAFQLAPLIFQGSDRFMLPILMIVPWIGFWCLFFLDRRATKVLRAQGIPVGLFGARRQSIAS